MNDPIEAYMKRLRAALRSLSAEEQKRALSEVEDHFTEGMADSQLGETLEERSQVLLREIGNPEELGYELQQLNRRQRWVDFLLAVMPAFFLTEVIEIIVMRIYYPPADPLFNEIALAILPLCGIMLWIAHRRASEPLLIFWLVVTLNNVLGPLQWSALGRPQLPFALLWAFTTVITLAWLLVTIWRVRQITLLFAFGSLPLLLQFVESAPVLQLVANLFSITVDTPGTVMSRPHFWFAAIFLTTVLSCGALALFFVSYQRLLRWLGLGLFVSAPSLANALFFGMNGGGSFLIVTVPVALFVTIVGVWLEQSRKSNLPLYSK